MMSTLKPRLLINSTRILTTVNMIIGREQKRYGSLTMETLNPLVKEVEYAVRGKRTKLTIPISFYYLQFSYLSVLPRIALFKGNDTKKKFKLVRTLKTENAGKKNPPHVPDTHTYHHVSSSNF